MCYLSGADTLFVHCSINTQRDRDRHTYRQKVLTDRQRDGHRQKVPTDIQTKDSNRQTYRQDRRFQQTMRHTYGQDIPTDKETNIQTKASSRQTDRYINMAYDDSKLKKMYEINESYK